MDMCNVVVTDTMQSQQSKMKGLESKFFCLLS